MTYRSGITWIYCRKCCIILIYLGICDRYSHTKYLNYKQYKESTSTTYDNTVATRRHNAIVSLTIISIFTFSKEQIGKDYIVSTVRNTTITLSKKQTNQRWIVLCKITPCSLLPCTCNYDIILYYIYMCVCVCVCVCLCAYIHINKCFPSYLISMTNNVKSWNIVSAYPY